MLLVLPPCKEWILIEISEDSQGINLPKMRNFAQGWIIFSCQILNLDAIELDRDLGNLEGAGERCGTFMPYSEVPM